MERKKLKFNIEVSVPQEMTEANARKCIKTAISMLSGKDPGKLFNNGPIDISLISIADLDLVKGELSKELFKCTEISINEKDMMLTLKPKDDKLPYKLVKLEVTGHDPEWEYVIPKNEKLEAINKCWPFEGDPLTADMEFWDLHSDLTVRASDLRIIRTHGANMVVSPHFYESGGMAVDLVPPDWDGFNMENAKE